jgi:methionine biosynthesis protein MetW
VTAAHEGSALVAASRIDLEIVAELVEPGSRVLDLGCGDGMLLDLLIQRKKVIGRGVEIDDAGVRACIGKGLSVHHSDLDEGLGDYPDQSFDYVILSQTLQTVYLPLLVMQEMLRVGKAGIVSFPNFGYWKVRSQLFARGRMPRTDYLPYEWYDTPNIHLLTVRDFEGFCRKHSFVVERAIYLCDGHRVSALPNVRAKEAIFLVRKAAKGD